MTKAIGSDKSWKTLSQLYLIKLKEIRQNINSIQCFLSDHRKSIEAVQKISNINEKKSSDQSTNITSKPLDSIYQLVQDHHEQNYKVPISQKNVQKAQGGLKAIYKVYKDDSKSQISNVYAINLKDNGIYQEQGIQNHQKLAGKKFKNLNNVKSVTMKQNKKIIELEPYQYDYQQGVLNKKVNNASGIQRTYHLRDAYNGMKQLRRNGLRYHNDIKPNNIGFNKNENVVIADYDFCGNPGEMKINENFHQIPHNDPQNIFNSITVDLNIKPINVNKDQTTKKIDDQIQSFRYGATQKTQISDRDKLEKARAISQKLAQKQQQIIDDYHNRGIRPKDNPKTKKMYSYKQTVDDLNNVILEDYRNNQKKQWDKQFKRDLGISTATTAVNAIRSTYETYKYEKSKANGNTKANDQITKKCVKTAVRQTAKGACGIGGKFYEKKLTQELTQKKILSNYQNYNQRTRVQPGIKEKSKIFLGVQAAKQIANLGSEYLFEGKVTSEQVKQSAKNFTINSAQYAAKQGVDYFIKKKIMKTGYETVTNYSANTVASTVGKKTILVGAKSATQSAKKTFTSTAFKSTTANITKTATNSTSNSFISSIKSTTKNVVQTVKSTASTFWDSCKSFGKTNALYSIGSAAVGTVFDCIRGQKFGDALKKNAKEAVCTGIGSTIGAAIGSVVPVIGTTIGGIVGGLVGSFFSSWF